MKKFPKRNVKIALYATNVSTHSKNNKSMQTLNNKHVIFGISKQK